MDPQEVPYQTVSLTKPPPPGFVQEREMLEVVKPVTTRPVGATGTGAPLVAATTGLLSGLPPVPL